MQSAPGMSSSDRIREEALKLFVQNGYEGASIEDIARQVGIRKASIYSHFKNKEDLYIQIFENAVKWDKEYFESLTQSFEKEDTKQKLKTILQQYCHIYTDEASVDRIRFVNRAMIYPPDFLRDKLQSIFASYETQFNQFFLLIIEEGQKKNILCSTPSRDILSFFYCIVDGLFVESFYYPSDIYEKRFDAIWSCFWRAIQK